MQPALDGLRRRLPNQDGSLERQVLVPRGLTLTGLAAGEIEVLRLVADGFDTAEISNSGIPNAPSRWCCIKSVVDCSCTTGATPVAYALPEALI